MEFNWVRKQLYWCNYQPITTQTQLSVQPRERNAPAKRHWNKISSDTRQSKIHMPRYSKTLSRLGGSSGFSKSTVTLMALYSSTEPVQQQNKTEGCGGQHFF